jgi:glycosyltransferase involved in cell wall biosynthesis
MSNKLASPDKLTILLIGPSMKVRGGISTLIETIGDRRPGNYEYRIIGTHSDCKGSHENETVRGKAAQAAVYFVGLLQIVAAILWYRRKIFHVHLSQEGSALRKGLICLILRFSRSRYLIHTHAAEDKLFHAWVPDVARRVILWGFRGSQYCLVLNQHWAEYYSQRLFLKPEQILILPNPADLPARVPDRTSGRKLNILFLGRLGIRKGVFDLIRAFALLPEEVRQSCQLTLAGDGELQAARDLATETGCITEVKVTGWVSRSQVVQLLKEADVLALPSYAEGMAIAVLEGMGWGCAVITTSAGGSTAFLEDHRNCLLVEPGNIRTISEAIQTLYDNKEMRLALGSEARRTAEMLSIDRYIDRLALIYQETAYTKITRTTRLLQDKQDLTRTPTN